MTAFQSWFAMGGYAPFVWSAYGVAAAVLSGLAYYSCRRHRRSGEELARLQQRAGARE